MSKEIHMGGESICAELSPTASSPLVRGICVMMSRGPIRERMVEANIYQLDETEAAIRRWNFKS